MKTKQLQWFTHTNCSSVEIKDYAHAIDKAPKTKKTIKDKDTIQKLRSLIEKLPAEGEMMIDFVETVSWATLDFQCEGGKDVVEFYDGRIKTPATSFYMRSQKLEDEVYKFVQKLLK